MGVSGNVVRLLATLVITVVSGCAYGAGKAEPRIVNAEESFELTLGESVRIEQTVVRFVGVEGDSRCPEGVQCIWEGSATLRFAIEGSDETFTVETSGGKQTVVAGKYQLVAEGLSPYPKEGKAIDASSYRATLRFKPVPVS